MWHASLPGHHAWLLSDQVDVLPFLLLPLAGPEEFLEDEMESTSRGWGGIEARDGRWHCFSSQKY